MRARDKCFSCGEQELVAFYELNSVPVHSCILVPGQKEASAFPHGALRLDFCPACGFIQNSLFRPELLDYSQEYEETQGFSPTFNAFSHRLAQDLVERYDLRGKQIFEIGCGKAEFLALVCELGGNAGIGIDPSAVPARVSADAGAGVEVIRAHYDHRYTHLSGDLVACRHTLEHIQPVARFVELSLISAARTPGAVIFYEVPDTLRILSNAVFWDIYHEHCSYFTPGSLARLFRRAKTSLFELRLEFEGQYVIVVASLDEKTDQQFSLEDDLAQTAALVDTFPDRVEEAIESWRARFHGSFRKKRKVGLWGGGSKAVAFVSTLGLGEELAYVVDINPFKQGLFLPGSAHPVVPPAHLAADPPDLVIAMNPVYVDEIAAEIDAQGVECELVTL